MISRDGWIPLHATFSRAMFVVAFFIGASHVTTGQIAAQNIFTSASVVDPATLDRLHSPILRRDLEILGAQSCAAASCHGGPRPGALQPKVRRGAEYMLWLEDDPHAQSWRTMCGEQSQLILRRLNILDRQDNIIDQAAFDNCLACHNSTQRYAVRPNGNPTVHRAEGVGCSACHGPSEQWIAAHDQYDFPETDAMEIGLVNAGDLYSRARMCASCHVGDKDRDMNHDIIAAGHPVLRYEFTTHHNRLPKHWRDAEACEAKTFEPQLWLAGQVASADASLSLIQSRASKSHSESVWPELASYDCASCHHHLGFRAKWGVGENSRARLSSWNDSGLRWVLSSRIASGNSTAEDAELIVSLDRIREIMSNAVNPDRIETAIAAGDARHALRVWFDSIAGSAERSTMDADRLNRIVAHAAGQAETFDSFESASQFYLAAIASRCGWPGGPAGNPRESADALRRLLKQYADQAVDRPVSPIPIRLAGVQLGGWLGPVHGPTINSRANAWQFDNSDEQDRLNKLFQEIDQRWQKRDAERAQQNQSNAPQNLEEPNTPDRPSVKSVEEALRELNRPNSGDLP